MVNKLKLGFIPECAEWIYSAGDAISAVAVSEKESNKIFVFDALSSPTPIHVFERLHTKPVIAMKVKIYDLTIS